MGRNVGKGVYPIILSNWYPPPDYYDPDTFIQPFLSCENGSEAEKCIEGASQANGSFYFSPASNDLVAKQRAEQDPAARQTVIANLQQVMVEDVPYVSSLAEQRLRVRPGRGFERRYPTNSAVSTVAND